MWGSPKRPSDTPLRVRPTHELDGFARLFIERLTRLVELHHQEGAVVTPPQRRLLDHAMYSTYEDCLASQAGYEAKVILNRGQLPGACEDHNGEKGAAS